MGRRRFLPPDGPEDLPSFYALMTCQELDRLLYAYLDGEFQPEERLEVEAHLSRCAACARRVHAEAQLQQANSDFKQAKDELNVKSDLQRRNPGIVPQRDIEKLQVLVDGRQAAIDAATAAKQSAAGIHLTRSTDMILTTRH